eukprot:6196307-Pleurochrysis_carterae.AAC.1
MAGVHRRRSGEVVEIHLHEHLNKGSLQEAQNKEEASLRSVKRSQAPVSIGDKIPNAARRCSASKHRARLLKSQMRCCDKGNYELNELSKCSRPIP